MNRTVMVLLIASCASCLRESATSGGGQTCPREGTVLADMRDVERDAEGVSYAVFGPVPDHAPDFTRAAGVLSLLQRVWDRATSACPDFPADAVASVNDAIARLEVSIPAQDQEASSYSSNDIHLQMAPLFEFFNPDTPVEVVRMDATFLRVGIDAWYGNWMAFDEDFSSLQVDWSALKATAEAKVPNCHRVAGTASVVGDIDETLANLATASSTQDVNIAQVESDAGLLEVDILELLFDCLPGSEPPTTGLGSVCATDADCGGTLVCNNDIAGGRCSPNTETTNVGAPCTTTVDCGTDGRDACLNEVGDGFAGGYCTMEPCDDTQVCPPGATCVALPFETPGCMLSCTDDSDCRADEGYVCQLFPTTPPIGFGPSEHACSFPCTTDDECTSPLTCNVATGLCVP